MDRRIREIAGACRAVLAVTVAAILSGCGGASRSDDHVEPCGGNLVGTWSELARDVTYPANPDINACSNLKGSFGAEGYSASSYFPSPRGRATLLTFEEGGNFHGAVMRVGPVTVDYAAACLATDQGTPSCAQLQEALNLSGIGEGWYRDTSCSDRPGGGCSCTVQVMEVGGPAGTWALSADQKSVTLTKPMGYPEPLATTVGYCVKDGGLKFDAPIDGSSKYLAYTADVTLKAPNCAGTPQQLNADYGTVCSVFCGTEACGSAP